MLSTEQLRHMKPISADSHVVEPPDAFAGRIQAKYRDIAPRGVDDEKRGALYLIEGLAPISLGGIAAAGMPPQQLSQDGRKFAQLHHGGWDPKARAADMERDGIFAEVLYPSVGMLVCNVEDLNYRRACMQAYNRWLEEFCAGLPGRLYGIGQTAAKDPESMVEDIIAIKQQGFRGVMLPDAPGVEDWDSPIYDRVWAAAIECDLPICFHILVKSTKEGNEFFNAKPRGGKMNAIQKFTRMVQDVLGVLIWGGVFDRHPQLRVVSVEADAGWLPYYTWKADTAYKRHRFWMGGRELKRLPSEVIRENLSFTFQDDRVAVELAHMMGPKALLWASDYPHSDSTWPESMEILSKTIEGIDPALVRRIVHDNAKELYRLDEIAA